MLSYGERMREYRAMVADRMAEGRPLSVKEREWFATELANIELEKSIADFGRQHATEPDSGETVTARTPGEAFAKSAEYRALIERGLVGTWSSGFVEFRSAAGDPVLESTGSNADALPRMYGRELVTPGLLQVEPTLADLFPQGDLTEGRTFTYPKATTRNAPADAATVEGEDKPGAEFAFDDATETLSKRAAFIPVSEEILEDSTAIAAYINAQLPLMVRQAEEVAFATQLYGEAGNGAAAITAIGATEAFDLIAAGIASIQVAAGGTRPDGLFIHPYDWWRLATAKATGTGNYFGNPFSATPDNPWGVRTVVSANATEGLPIVGAFRRGGQVWSKGGVRLAASNSHSDYFRKNQVAIRAERRSLLAVYYPEMFVAVPLGS